MGQNTSKLFASKPLNVTSGQNNADFRSLETKQMSKDKKNSQFLFLFYIVYIFLIILILIIFVDIMYSPSSFMTQNDAQNITENALTLM